MSALCLIIPVNHSTPSLNPSPVKALLALKIKYFRVYKILQINANIPSHIPYMPWFIINLLKLHQIAHLNEIKSQWIGQFMLSDSYHYHITLLVRDTFTEDRESLMSILLAKNRIGTRLDEISILRAGKS